MGISAEGHEASLRHRIEELEAALEARSSRARDDEHDARMDAIGRLAEGIANELDEIVHVLSSSAKVVEEDLRGVASRRTALTELGDATRRATDLVRRLRAAGGSRLKCVELLDLNEVVERFVALVRRAFPESVELDFIPGHALPRVAADPALLEQVLLHLALHARDALPRGGRIAIETEGVVVPRVDGAPIQRPDAGRYVRLTVSDDGRGLSAETCERLFEPFFAPTGAGGGLGLAIVYGAVRLHGGTIRVNSEADHGTKFEILLPAHSGADRLRPAG